VVFQHTERLAKTVSALAVSRDGTLVAIGSVSGAVLVLDCESGKSRFEVAGAHKERVLAMTFADDSGALFSTSKDREIFQWDIAAGTVGKKWSAGKKSLNALCVSPDAKLLFGAGSVIRAWDVATQKVVLNLAGHAGKVSWIDYAHSSDVLVVGSRDDQFVHLWKNVSSCGKASAPSAVLVSDWAVSQVAVSRGSAEFVVSIGSDSKSSGINVWKVPAETSKPVEASRKISCAEEAILAFKLVDDSNLLICSGKPLDPKFRFTVGAVLVLF
jgi:WD40 repeat protein